MRSSLNFFKNIKFTYKHIYSYVVCNIICSVIIFITIIIISRPPKCQIYSREIRSAGLVGTEGSLIENYYNIHSARRVYSIIYIQSDTFNAIYSDVLIVSLLETWTAYNLLLYLVLKYLINNTAYMWLNLFSWLLLHGYCFVGENCVSNISKVQYY